MFANMTSRRRTTLLQIGSILLLPWAWTVLVVPAWVSVVCVSLWAAALWAIDWMLLAPAPGSPAAGDGAGNVVQLLKRRYADAAVSSIDPRVIEGDLGSLHRGLGRWKESSRISSGETAVASDRVVEVMSETERACLALTVSFRGITSKARQQMDTAMALLRRNAEQASISPGGWLSLPDYIRAYETQLQEVIDSMLKLPEAADELLRHQKKVREQSVLIDELVDELRSMAIRIGRLALDSTMATAKSGGNPEQLVRLAESIRTTSDQTHGLTRTVRRSLETIRDELVTIHKVIEDAAGCARNSAQRAKADVAQLNVTMIEKTREVEESLSRINGLGEAIQQDVNRAIIAMQFQDITQQQLEHMRGKNLAEVMRALDDLSNETQEMMNRNIFGILDQDAGRQADCAGGDAKPHRHRTAPSGTPGHVPADPGSARAADAVAPTAKVELF